MPKSTVHSVDDALSTLRFLDNRTPTSTDIEDAFCRLAAYRDGGIFLAHYAGNSEWERHPNGDEVVMVLEGATVLVLLVDGGEVSHELRARELLVVPQNTWHRFESPEAVKIMTVTPQPTDHSVAFPE